MDHIDRSKPPKNTIDTNTIITRRRKNDAVASAKMTPKDTAMYIDVVRQGFISFTWGVLKFFCVHMLVFWSMVR